jgi:hypothetical protein
VERITGNGFRERIERTGSHNTFNTLPKSAVRNPLSSPSQVRKICRVYETGQVCGKGNKIKSVLGLARSAGTAMGVFPLPTLLKNYIAALASNVSRICVVPARNGGIIANVLLATICSLLVQQRQHSLEALPTGILDLSAILI